jgi:hypothetical protein
MSARKRNKCAQKRSAAEAALLADVVAFTSIESFSLA